MIRRANEIRSFARGQGVEIKVLVEPEEIYEAGRLYAHITFEPGATIDFHNHLEEMESFYVIKGSAKVDDNGETTRLEEGDVMVTPAGYGHSVHNDGDKPLEMMALIVSCKQGFAGCSKEKRA